MTYLEAINNIMRELRESEVASLSSDYAKLVGQWVNAAKDEVEAAWDWKSLRTDITISTVAGTASYTLAGTNERSRLCKNDRGWPQVFNMTQDGARLSIRTREWIREMEATTPPNSIPFTYALERNNSGLSLVFSPKPDGVYNIQVTAVIPQDRLTATTTHITVPAEPVWRRALVMAVSERTGGMGDTSANLSRIAYDCLQDYIEREKDGPQEGTFYAD